jgi:hypothetical protein
MKISPRLLFLTGLSVGLGTLAMAQGLGQGLGAPGSPHNFSDNIGAPEVGPSGWNDSQELCRVCHVPHDHNRTTGSVGFLWNHGLSSRSYTMYSSSSIDGTTSAQPVGVTKMCLGCHDGTVALGTFEGHTGSTFVASYGASNEVPGAQLGNSLAATHPISIIYDETADRGLHPKTRAMGTSGTIGDVLENNMVQCSSCHDVHDQPGKAVPGTALLRVAQTGSNPSGLCLTCHIK